ncbi:MAG: hypothetical protein AAF229_15285 [Pseudomonadota bacterium]
MSETMPRSAKGRRPAFFEDKALDAMVTMVLELTTELWVTKERMAAIEAVLGEAAPDLAARIEAWEPEGEARAALDAKRAEYLQTILRTLESEFTPRAEIQKAQDEFGDATIAEADA